MVSSICIMRTVLIITNGDYMVKGILYREKADSENEHAAYHSEIYKTQRPPPANKNFRTIH
ncbi:hypothetical protein J6TS1_00140 [Siminovitchia terrae]|uniref:Uncharacterized protein n=1 Tax=Siminovitchia terrae TaxID=1914933 RepID=A0ABQ4KQ09_SIMTE|nr:hypothetical protein J6TS1_00140 [Siminovitchia terrae]